MENYEKRTKYLDYAEYDNKVRNGGVLRTERTGEVCRVQISVRGLYPTDSIPVEIYLESGEKRYKADGMTLKYGTGTYSAIWNANNLAGSGMGYCEWSGMELVVSEHRRLCCRWEIEKEMMAETVAEPAADEQNAEINIKSEQVEIKDCLEIKQEMKLEVKPETECGTKNETENAMGNMIEMVTESFNEKKKAVNSNEYERIPEKNRFAELFEDKWTQLQHHYRTVRPFGDKRSYLSVTPNDFIVLGRQYQKLVSNSFLLHGYYNYGHLILARIEEGEGYRYYLGVPGTYHEREKQAARMFGFEGFEGAASANREGGFGYYMLQVEI